jgi:hypothetical protein
MNGGGGSDDDGGGTVVMERGWCPVPTFLLTPSDPSSNANEAFNLLILEMRSATAWLAATTLALLFLRAFWTVPAGG